MADEDPRRRQRGRNLALAWFLGGLVVLFFILTLVKLQGAWG